MTQLSSFRASLNAAVIGSSGGIGRAFVEQLAADAAVRRVYAFSRTPTEWTDHKIRGHMIDLADETTIEAASTFASTDEALDLVIVASGILHRDDGIKPEKSLRELNAKILSEVLMVNTIGPALVSKHFLPTLRRRHKSVFAALSARIGSIGDNRLGGWASYRLSKAALNMLTRTAAIEQARTRPQSIVVALHPGTVDTPLSEPFTGRLDPDRLFSPQRAASQLLRVMDGLQAPQTGGFFAYDGKPIEF